MKNKILHKCQTLHLLVRVTKKSQAMHNKIAPQNQNKFPTVTYAHQIKSSSLLPYINHLKIKLQV